VTLSKQDQEHPVMRAFFVVKEVEIIKAKIEYVLT